MSSFRRLLASWVGSERAESGPTQVTREHVLWAYRLFLDREPESPSLLDERVEQWASTAQLRRDFMSSPEFHARNPGGFGLDLERNVVIKEIGDGLRLFVDVSDCTVGMNILRGHYESEELAFVASKLRPGQTALDLGSNVGYFSIRMAALVGPEGRVVAFDPIPANIELLRRSVSENGFTDRVETHRAGVGSSPDTGRFVALDPNGASSGGTFRAPGFEAPPGHVLVEAPIVALDDLDLPRPVHFVKADIEGSEPLAFRGARKILSEDRPIILCEINPEQLQRVSQVTPGEFVAEIEAMGYKCRSLGGRRVRSLGDGVVSVAFLPK